VLRCNVIVQTQHDHSSVMANIKKQTDLLFSGATNGNFLPVAFVPRGSLHATALCPVFAAGTSNAESPKATSAAAAR
jgi:hypothetical protein